MATDKPRRGPPRTAKVFDAQAIADRVAARQQAAAETTPAVHKPLHHDDGPVRTGTGDGATHLDLPAHATTHVDLFDRLAEAEERRRVRSPFGDHPAPAGALDRTDRIDYRRLARPDLAEIDVLDRFTTPDIDDLWDEDDTMDTPPPDARTKPGRSADVPRSMDHEPCPNDACGQLLTGGGAPRGWVLVRIIGSGPPRRYCSPACAARAILGASEARAKQVSEVKLPPRQRPRPNSRSGEATRRRMAQVAATGATTADVRRWALANGVACGSRGTPGQSVVDAFLAAHRAVAS